MVRLVHGRNGIFHFKSKFVFFFHFKFSINTQFTHFYSKKIRKLQKKMGFFFAGRVAHWNSRKPTGNLNLMLFHWKRYLFHSLILSDLLSLYLKIKLNEIKSKLAASFCQDHISFASFFFLYISFHFISFSFCCVFYFSLPLVFVSFLSRLVQSFEFLTCDFFSGLLLLLLMLLSFLLFTTNFYFFYFFLFAWLFK